MKFATPRKSILSLIVVFFFLLLPRVSLAQDENEIIKEELQSLVVKKDWHAANEIIDNFNAYYLQNSSALQTAKEYVDQVSSAVKRAVEGEEGTYKSLVESPSSLKASRYLKKYPLGKYRDSVKKMTKGIAEEESYEKAKLSNAINDYESYLRDYPQGKFSDEAKRIIEEEFYKRAKKLNSISSHRSYLIQYPFGKFSEESKRIIEDKYYQKAMSTNNMSDYEAYLKRYPGGKYADSFSQIVENSYLSYGNTSYEAKDYNEAKKHFQKFLVKFPNSYRNYGVRKKIEKCDRMLNQKGMVYCMYTYDKESALGLSFGRLSKSSLGIYVNFKLAPMALEKFFSVLYTIDNNGESDSYDDLVRRTGESEDANFSMSIGPTFKIYYPLWGYAGLGAGVYSVYEEVETYDTDRNGGLTSKETDWMRNTDETKFVVFPEAGLKLKLGSYFLIKYGVMYRDGIIHQLGIGFRNEH